MLGSNSFRREQTVLAGIELVQMIRKGQLHHPAGDGLSPAEQFYLLAAIKNRQCYFAGLDLLMRQGQLSHPSMRRVTGSHYLQQAHGIVASILLLAE